MMTLDLRLLKSVGIAGLVLIASYLAGISYSYLIFRPFTWPPSSDKSAPASSGIIVNLPRAVTSVNDGQDRNVCITNWLLLPTGSYVSCAIDRTKE